MNWDLNHILLVVAVIIGFYKAWNIGANDVANGMGTVVGAGTLSLKQAIILASCFEFLGAFLVGSNVTDTIKEGIVSPAAFTDPFKFGVGMLAVALSSSIWLHISTMMSRPISVTHCTVGGIIGFATVAAGPQSIHWRGLGLIGLTWIASPLVGALGAYVVYRSIVAYVLKHTDPVHRAKRVVPIGFGATAGIIFFAVTFKGLTHLQLHIKPWEHVLLTLGVAILCWLMAVLMVHRHTDVLTPDRHQMVEDWFGRLQVMTACYMSFAHGTNDVASAIGPLAGSMQAFSGQGMGGQTHVSPWLMAFGGAGIVIGLATMGYKVITAVGKSITEITPTRGFSAEFATASIVLVCSKIGIPLSTTFVMVGAIMGVGFARGFAAIDMKVVRKILTSWIITIPIAAFLSATVYLILLAILGRQ